VELMVALVITLILLAGIGQIFLSSKKSFTIQDSLGRIQENGRYALETVVADLRRAGYWGGNSDITDIAGTEAVLSETGDCTSTDILWATRLDRRIYGKNGSKTDAEGTYDCIPATYVRGDILVTRFMAPWLIGGITTDANHMANNPNHYYLRTSLFRGALFKGANAADAGNDVTGATVRTAELVARTYFIATSGTSGTCPADGQVPSLYRRVVVNGALQSEEVAHGVDNLQVQYGVDTDDDDAIDRYLNAGDGGLDSTDEWNQVIAVRVWLLMRAECPETGYTNDNTYAMGDVNYTPADTAGRGYRRQLYSATVSLRNSSF
jgi:type IV pilus assembly protein PilW